MSFEASFTLLTNHHTDKRPPYSLLAALKRHIHLSVLRETVEAGCLFMCQKLNTLYKRVTADAHAAIFTYSGGTLSEVRPLRAPCGARRPANGWPETGTGNGQTRMPTLAVFVMPKVSPEVWPRVVIFAQEPTVRVIMELEVARLAQVARP